MGKHRPVRQCMGCRSRREKQELLRVVRTPQNQVELDPSGKKPGRGAYLCPTSTCLERAISTNAFSRALNFKLDRELVEALRRQLSGDSSRGPNVE